MWWSLMPSCPYLLRTRPVTQGVPLSLLLLLSPAPAAGAATAMRKGSVYSTGQQPQAACGRANAQDPVGQLLLRNPLPIVPKQCGLSTCKHENRLLQSKQPQLKQGCKARGACSARAAQPHGRSATRVPVTTVTASEPQFKAMQVSMAGEVGMIR